jgi:hypothetical protein
MKSISEGGSLRLVEKGQQKQGFDNRVLDMKCGLSICWQWQKSAAYVDDVVEKLGL